MATASSISPSAYVRDLWARRDFALYMAVGRIKARNASTGLGLLWWVLNPLILASIFMLVFGVIFEARKAQEHYLAYLLSGIFAFYYTRGAMIGGPNTIISNAKMLANLNFPRLVLPLSSIAEALFGFLASLVAYFIIIAVGDQVWAGWGLTILPLALLLHTIFNFGLAALTARLAVPFRDVNNLVPYILRLWLYLSPIVYSLDQAPDWLRTILLANPLVPILSLWRTALMGEPFEPIMLLVATVWAFGIAVVGTVTFVRIERDMVRYL